MDKGQFTIVHCQRSQPVTYDIAGWRLRVREHPSTRIVSQILPESKNRGIASLYRGVSSHTSSSYKDTQSSRLSRHPSLSNPTIGIKKSSCLKTKFQLVSVATCICMWSCFIIIHYRILLLTHCVRPTSGTLFAYCVNHLTTCLEPLLLLIILIIMMTLLLFKDTLMSLLLGISWDKLISYQHQGYTSKVIN